MSEFEEVAQRIRALTTILEKLKRRNSPTPSVPRNIPKYLDQFVTLLTCGDDVNTSTANVVTAAGSLQVGKVQILIVAQNLNSKLPVPQSRIEQLYKGERSFEEVVSGRPDAPTLQEHITDIWTALAGYDPDSPTSTDNFISLASFVVSRCFRKIQTRFNEDQYMFRKRQRLFQLIDDWCSSVDLNEDIPVQWITIPDWLNGIFREPKIEERKVDVGGRTELQWKLAGDTVKAWAGLLSRLLKALNDAIERASKIRSEGQLSRAPSDEERAEMRRVSRVLNCLYHFVRWKGGVVRFLVEETSLRDRLLARMGRFGAVDDEEFKEWDLRMECSETAGNRVLRYLSSLTAWHAALDELCSKPFLRQADLQVGFIEVPLPDSKVCAEVEFVETYLKRWHWRNEPDRTHPVEMIKECYPETFMPVATNHAEATLMGLLAFVKRDEGVNYMGNIQNKELLREFLHQAEDAVAVATKCCWCCARLAALYHSQLGVKFRIPGTHGVILAWSPPTIGIPVEVLRKLENELWSELRSAISEARTAKARLLARASGSGRDGWEGLTALVAEEGAQRWGSF